MASQAGKVPHELSGQSGTRIRGCAGTGSRLSLSFPRGHCKHSLSGLSIISDSSSQTLSPRRCPVRPSLWGPRCWRGGRISSAVASSTSRCSGPRPARPKPTALCGAAWCSCAFYSDHQFHSDHQYWRLYVLTEGEERPLGQDSSGGHRHPTPRGSQKGVGIWPSEE